MAPSSVASPLVVDVTRMRFSGSSYQEVHQEGPAPARIGVDMIGAPEGSPLVVDIVCTPLNGAVVVSGTVLCQFEGQCSRCLRAFTADEEFELSAVFAENSDFLDSDDSTDDEDAEESYYPLVNDRIDLLDALVNEAGLSLPFNPVCEDYDLDCDNDEVPQPDGVSGEESESVAVDPRWAGLEKFK